MISPLTFTLAVFGIAVGAGALGSLLGLGAVASKLGVANRAQLAAQATGRGIGTAG